MSSRKEIEGLVKLVVQKIDFSAPETPAKSFKTAAQTRARPVKEFLIDILQSYSKSSPQKTKKYLPKFFGIESLQGIFYGKKLTDSHVINILMILWGCKTANELIQKIVSLALAPEEDEKLRNSEIEWHKLDENEKMFLIYCAKKYGQLNKKSKKK